MGRKRKLKDTGLIIDNLTQFDTKEIVITLISKSNEEFSFRVLEEKDTIIRTMVKVFINRLNLLRK